MPLKLKPPRAGKTPYYSIRGTHLGKYVDRSAKTGNRALAQRLLKKIERDIESGSFIDRAEPTFTTAALAYMQAGGERRFLKPLLEHFRDTPLRDIDQIAIDGAAEALYPDASAATRNRQVYSPVSAICRRAGRKLTLHRPRGSAGNAQTVWLWPEQAYRLFEEAEKIDKEFAALLITLCYTGMRLSEALKLTWNDVRLEDGYAYITKTKNSEPRPVFLPPVVVAALSDYSGHDRAGERKSFRFQKSGHLYSLLRVAAIRAGVELPPRGAFHILRHTYATWMRRYAGADEQSLIATGAWKDKKSVSRYTHTVIQEEARRAEMLPTPERKVG